MKRLANAKQSANEDGEWLQSAPIEYTEIATYLMSSSAEETPDYDRLDKLLSKAIDRVKENTIGEMKLDWEPDGEYYDNLHHLV